MVRNFSTPMRSPPLRSVNFAPEKVQTQDGEQKGLEAWTVGTADPGGPSNILDTYLVPESWTKSLIMVSVRVTMPD